MTKEMKIKLINHIISYDSTKSYKYYDYYNKEKFEKLELIILNMKSELKELRIKELEYMKEVYIADKIGENYYVKKEQLIVVQLTIKEYENYRKYVEILISLIICKIEESEYKTKRNKIIIEILRSKFDIKRSNSFINSELSKNEDNFTKAIALTNLLDAKEIRDQFIKEIDIFLDEFTNNELEMLIVSLYKTEKIKTKTIANNK